MIISKTVEFDMAHRLKNHDGQCRNFHGHRYKLEVFVSEYINSIPGNTSEGMIIDFGDMKRIIDNEIIYKYDHSMMIELLDPYYEYFEQMKTDGLKIRFKDYTPTAENMIKEMFIDLKQAFECVNIRLVKLKLWETPTSMAELKEGDIN